MSAPAAIRLVGRERQPLVVIDDAVSDPDRLRRIAAATPFTPAGHHYPGLRAPLPPDYLPALMPTIDAALASAFDYRGGAEVVDASFSIVTTPPDALSVPQRLPHMDAFDQRRIAFVHYLAPHCSDGTALYRHRSTGFETVDEARRHVYFGQVESELRRIGVPAPGYLNGETALFERIDAVEARYNRLVLYRSVLLHSGAISPDAALTADPATGRLTVTAFLHAR